jgi:pimeloyl-ACP methyl ester carboxylesterase
MEDAMAKAGVVLVHGAWADGSSWQKVVAGLGEVGIDAITAPLPLSSLADDVRAIERSIERVAGPVVLVGHAYAGGPIGEVRSERVQGLVYVAALAPDEGETVVSNYVRGESHPLAPQLAPDAHGWIWLPRTAFANAFSPDADPQEQRVLYASQRPISPACITVPVQRPLWRDRPSWYLVAEDDRMIARDNQRFMAQRMKATIRSIATGHTPGVTAAAAVVSLILEAVEHRAA